MPLATSLMRTLNRVYWVQFIWKWYGFRWKLTIEEHHKTIFVFLSMNCYNVHTTGGKCAKASDNTFIIWLLGGKVWQHLTHGRNSLPLMTIAMGFFFIFQSLTFFSIFRSAIMVTFVLCIMAYHWHKSCDILANVSPDL